MECDNTSPASVAMSLPAYPLTITYPRNGLKTAIKSIQVEIHSVLRSHTTSDPSVMTDN